MRWVVDQWVLRPSGRDKHGQRLPHYRLVSAESKVSTVFRRQSLRNCTSGVPPVPISVASLLDGFSSNAVPEADDEADDGVDACTARPRSIDTVGAGTVMLLAATMPTAK